MGTLWTPGISKINQDGVDCKRFMDFKTINLSFIYVVFTDPKHNLGKHDLLNNRLSTLFTKSPLHDVMVIVFD